MTAFKEVLSAEQEAEQAIESAKEEVAASILNAKNEQKARLESEIAKLQAAEKLSLEQHKAHIATLVGKIQFEIKGQVSTIEGRFTTHKADLKSKLIKSF